MVRVNHVGTRAKILPLWPVNLVVLLALISLGIMAVVMHLPIPVAALLLLIVVTLYHAVSPAA